MIPNNCDLVVEPHELTPEDREAFSKAIKEYREGHDTAKMGQKILDLLERRKQDAEDARSTDS